MLFPPFDGDEVAAHDRRGAEAKERRHDVESADDPHRPDHTDAGRLRIGHRIEANQNVRQSRRAKDQRHAKRNQIERPIGRLVAQARAPGSSS